MDRRRAWKPKGQSPIPSLPAETWKRNSGQAWKRLWRKKVQEEGTSGQRPHDGKEPGGEPRQQARCESTCHRAQ